MLKWEQIDKGWRIWNFTFLSVIFKWHGGSERVKYQEWVKDSRPCWGVGGGVLPPFVSAAKIPRRLQFGTPSQLSRLLQLDPSVLANSFFFFLWMWPGIHHCLVLHYQRSFDGGGSLFQFLLLIWRLASLFSLPQAPARAMYMLWVNILGPWFFAEAPEQQADDKKAKKMERKMKRLQQR